MYNGYPSFLAWVNSTEGQAVLKRTAEEREKEAAYKAAHPERFYSRKRSLPPSDEEED